MVNFLIEHEKLIELAVCNLCFGAVAVGIIFGIPALIAPLSVIGITTGGMYALHKLDEHMNI